MSLIHHLFSFAEKRAGALSLLACLLLPLSVFAQPRFDPRRSFLSAADAESLKRLEAYALRFADECDRAKQYELLRELGQLSLSADCQKLRLLLKETVDARVHGASSVAIALKVDALKSAFQNSFRQEQPANKDALLRTFEHLMIAPSRSSCSGSPRADASATAQPSPPPTHAN